MIWQVSKACCDQTTCSLLDAMRKHLYFICPTDYLEATINQVFGQENYFVTSLGNNLDFDTAHIEEINALIQSKDIGGVSIILADNNPIVLDALGDRRFATISSLDNLYHQISRQQQDLSKLWHSTDLSTTILSAYLADKVDKLNAQLRNRAGLKVAIDAKIFNPQTDVFSEIFATLIPCEYFMLN